MARRSSSSYKRRSAAAVLAACVLAPEIVQAFLPSCGPRAATSWAARPVSYSYERSQQRVRQQLVVAHAFDASEYDGFLGELIFSSNDPAYDIAINFERASDEKFRAWLNAKVKGCNDLEERVALSSLCDIMDAVIKKIEETMEAEPAIADAEFSSPEVSAAAAAASSEPQVRRSNEEIFREVRSMQGVGGSAADLLAADEAERTAVAAAAAAAAERKSVWEGIPEAVRQSYEQVLKTLLDRSPEVSLSQAVDAAYEKCDIQFLALLKEKRTAAEAAAAGGAAGAAADAQALTAVSDEVNAAMNRRMTAATQKLQALLSSGNPAAIQVAAVKLAREGGVDDALVLLLEANIQQAQQAGPPGAGAFRVMSTIRDTFNTEADRKVEPEKRVLRQCLRENDPATREEILREAFRPRAKLALVGGGESSEEPLLPPPVFINAVRALRLNFGNIDGEEKEFAAKVEAIIAAAEKVATELYGDSMSPQEQQDRAWKEHGSSVWDLEKIEDQARLKGEEVPWANDKYDYMLPGLNKGAKQGEFKIGGS